MLQSGKDRQFRHKMLYYVIFRCHLIEMFRPEGWPKYFEPAFEYECATPKQLVGCINQQLAIMWHSGILIPNPDINRNVVVGAEHQDVNGFDRFALLPKHMISYVQTVTTVKKIQPADEPESGIQVN
jgi:hypothetical protein